MIDWGGASKFQSRKIECSKENQRLIFTET